MTVLGISGGTGFCRREIVSTALQKGIRVISFQRTIEEKSDLNLCLHKKLLWTKVMLEKSNRLKINTYEKYSFQVVLKKKIMFIFFRYLESIGYWMGII